MRRRKVGNGSAEKACNLEDTPEPGEERWAGDPEEEPAQSVGNKPPPPQPAEVPLSTTEPPRKDRHPMPWGLVITDVFNLDVHKTLTRLEKELSLGDGATEYGTVLHAVDKSAKNLFDAARLARKAKLVDQQFSDELDRRLEVLRSSAQAALEEEKAKGLRSKAPTIQDIKDRMMASWPDEMSSINTRKEEMHGAFRAIEAMEHAWRERNQSLRVMAQGFRTTGA
jgi:hypothetical protein